MADSYQGTDNFTAPSEESKDLEFDTTQSMEEEEEEDNDVTQMGKEIVEFKSIPSKSGRRKRRRLSSEVWEVFVKLPRSSDGRERNKCKLCGKVYLCESILATALVTLKQNLESEDVFLKKLTNQMYTKFYKYWADSCTILAIAVILDPRYKMKFVEFAFEKVYGDGSEQLELVRNTLYSLFSEYMTNSTGTSTSKASFASGVTSTFTHGTSFDLMDTVMKEFDSSLVSDDCIQKTQLELYLDEPRLDRSMDLDILSFWKVNEFRYPVLATMARDVLTIPISTVTSKSAFNIDGRNLDEYHSSLKPNVMNAMFCTRDWLYEEEESRTLKWDEIAKDVLGF